MYPLCVYLTAPLMVTIAGSAKIVRIIRIDPDPPLANQQSFYNFIINT